MFELIPFNTRRAPAYYNPFRELDELERAVFGAPFFERTVSANAFRTDIKDNGDNFVLEADLPGVDKKDINVSLEGDTLTVKAERHSEHEDENKKKNYISCERSYGSYQRSFDVSGIDTENISVAYDKGVLTVTMPKKVPDAPKTRTLEIM